MHDIAIKSRTQSTEATITLSKNERSVSVKVGSFLNVHNPLMSIKPYWMLCIIVTAIIVISSAGCTTQTPSTNRTIGGITIPTTTGPPTPAEAQQIAAAAYVFSYPLVLMGVIEDQATAAPAPDPDQGMAPIN
jgi:hypothetical protein